MADAPQQVEDNEGSLAVESDHDTVNASVRPIVSVDVIDEAVEQVIREQELAPAVADGMRRLLSTDMRSGAAHAYYTNMATRGSVGLVSRDARKQLVLQYVLTDDQMAALTAYAPEYRLIYRSRDVHDHPMAAASRIIDRQLVYTRLPLAGNIIDVGSAVVEHILAGALGGRVHACRPLVDAKDPSRATQDRLKVSRLMERTTSAEVRSSAAKFLSRDVSAVCGLTVQECDRQADFIAAVHVYDIRMDQWAGIMERHGARVVEGCMLFSPAVFDQRRGVMDVAGARFEVDPAEGRFRMGFVGSPAWWYEHDWVEYLKYGVDQILIGDKGVYSYKVVERRGDTIFFRILPVAGKPMPQGNQVYLLPGVPMVEVSGFSVERSDKRLTSRRKTYMWPLPLWEDMLSHAKVMADRGTLDYERLYNHYRTVAPRQTINAVSVAGGHTVDVMDLVPLIVHVALAAAIGVARAQIEIDAHVTSELRSRYRQGESTPYKMLAAMGETIKSLVGLVFYPFLVVGSLIGTLSESLMSRGLVDWEPQVRVRGVSAKLLLTGEIYQESLKGVVAEPVDLLIRESAPFNHIEAALRDKDLAVQLLAGFFDSLPADVLRALEDVVGPGAVSVEMGNDGKASSVVVKSEAVHSAAPPSYKTQPSEAGDRASMRAMAIREAIVQCEYEMRAVSASMATYWRELVPETQPRVSQMRSRAEEYRDPMFWWVENGIIRSPITDPNKVVEEFEHSAVYTAVPDPETGSHVRPIFEESYEGLSEGREVCRTYVKLADVSYTGWAFTNNSVIVYNGPELISAMELALTKDLAFETRLVAGPPGCGKTYQICQVVDVADVVLAPARKIMRDTRRALVAKSQALAAVAQVRCRTTDSYLVNYTLNAHVRDMTADRLMADEAFMAHSGRWWACAALLGVSRVWFYGDVTQIPPVVRPGAPKMFVRVQDLDEVVDLWLTYRCPASAVASWGDLYSWKVRTKSNVEGALLHVDKPGSVPDWPGQVMLGFYQADKKELNKLYASRSPRPRIATVHEVQGETLTSVRLHRFDYRKRTDSLALFDNPSYVLVAMSRHKENFAYVSPRLGDLVEKWVRRGSDPRRVQAAADVASEGQSKEFI